MSYPPSNYALSEYTVHEGHRQQPTTSSRDPPAHYHQQSQTSWNYQSATDAQWGPSQPTRQSLDQPYQSQSQMSLGYRQSEAAKNEDGVGVEGEIQGKENWKKWMPKRTKFLVAWFSFFGLGAIALTLIALFGCYSTATSNFHIIRMEPYSIYDASVSSLLRKSPAAKNDNSTNATSIPSSDFFTNPLPWRYEVGIAGVCRVFNSTYLSSPSVTFKTECQPQLHPPLDLLYFISQDVPDGISSSQYKNWENLLNEAVPGIQDNAVTAAQRARLLVASSILLILSIIWSLALIIATAWIERMYPRWSLSLDVLDALLVIAASVMWTVVATQVQNAYTFTGTVNPVGVDTGPGFSVLWAIGVAKLVVTPMMMIGLIRAIIWAAMAALLCVKCLLAACPKWTQTQTETVYMVTSTPLDGSSAF